ncbi:hypothetical protein [Tateyamaria sp. SN6-1]|uniref:hypothetical protein n=1 Tax=Tateyamaria sp. SN6-1 TaxID=3092148 RepID=UPI0039F547DC
MTMHDASGHLTTLSKALDMVDDSRKMVAVSRTTVSKSKRRAEVAGIRCAHARRSLPDPGNGSNQ